MLASNVAVHGSVPSPFIHLPRTLASDTLTFSILAYLAAYDALKFTTTPTTKRTRTIRSVEIFRRASCVVRQKQIGTINLRRRSESFSPPFPFFSPFLVLSYVFAPFHHPLVLPTSSTASVLLILHLNASSRYRRPPRLSFSPLPPLLLSFFHLFLSLSHSLSPSTRSQSRTTRVLLRRYDVVMPERRE